MAVIGTFFTLSLRRTPGEIVVDFRAVHICFAIPAMSINTKLIHLIVTMVIFQALDAQTIFAMAILAVVFPVAFNNTCTLPADFSVVLVAVTVHDTLPDALPGNAFLFIMTFVITFFQAVFIRGKVFNADPVVTADISFIFAVGVIFAVDAISLVAGSVAMLMQPALFAITVVTTLVTCAVIIKFAFLAEIIDALLAVFAMLVFGTLFTLSIWSTVREIVAVDWRAIFILLAVSTMRSDAKLIVLGVTMP